MRAAVIFGARDVLDSHVPPRELVASSSGSPPGGDVPDGYRAMNEHEAITVIMEV